MSAARTLLSKDLKIWLKKLAKKHIKCIVMNALVLLSVNFPSLSLIQVSCILWIWTEDAMHETI